MTCTRTEKLLEWWLGIFEATIHWYENLGAFLCKAIGCWQCWQQQSAPAC